MSGNPIFASDVQIHLGVFKLYEDARLPEFKTPGAACFDIYSHFTNEVHVNGEKRYLDTPWVTLEKGDIALIPTGIILDIPSMCSVRLHPRSGMALSGLTLVNCEGIIDSDYTHELMVAVIYQGKEPTIIAHHQRIAQGEMVYKYVYPINEINTRPERTERTGGFGSTGKD